MKKSRCIQSIFLIAIIFICDTKIAAQPIGYTYLNWDDITLVENNASPCDTSMVIITNRKYDPLNKGKEFLSNQIDPDGKLTYLIASCNNNQWTCSVRENFEEAMKSTKISNDFLFFVNGAGQTFPDLLDKCIRIDRLYDVNIIAFDWPSKEPGYSRIRTFYNAKKKARQSVFDFSETLLLLQNYKAGNKNLNKDIHFTLFMHSLGNHILEKFIESPLSNSLRANLFDNVLLNAAAVKQKNHRNWVEKMNFQNRIFITSNKKDYVLNGARLITFRRQLGERVKKPLAKNANYINFRNLVYLKHNYFIELPLLSSKPSLHYFYNTIFHGGSLKFEEGSRFKKRKDGLGYDIL
jgi:hypothetical protein